MNAKKDTVADCTELLNNVRAAREFILDLPPEDRASVIRINRYLFGIVAKDPVAGPVAVALANATAAVCVCDPKNGGCSETVHAAILEQIEDIKSWIGGLDPNVRTAVAALGVDILGLASSEQSRCFVISLAFTANYVALQNSLFELASFQG